MIPIKQARMQMPRISLADQAAELWRIYRARSETMLRGAIPPHQRATAREQQRRQEALLAAFRSLDWLAKHPAVLRGYLAFCDPLTRNADGWTEPPDTLEDGPPAP
jgi:hypothetical protein